MLALLRYLLQAKNSAWFLYPSSLLHYFSTFLLCSLHCPLCLLHFLQNLLSKFHYISNKKKHPKKVLQQFLCTSPPYMTSEHPPPHVSQWSKGWKWNCTGLTWLSLPFSSLQRGTSIYLLSQIRLTISSQISRCKQTWHSLFFHHE